MMDPRILNHEDEIEQSSENKNPVMAFVVIAIIVAGLVLLGMLIF